MTGPGSVKRIAGEGTGEKALKGLLSSYGISTPKGYKTKKIEDEVKLRYPLVLKVSDPTILHKTEAGGVKTGIMNLAQLREEFDKMSSRFPGREFLVEEMAESGVEIIIGVVRDEELGLVMMLGMGGIYTELYNDVTFRLLPIDKFDAEDMIDEVAVKRFVNGFRGVSVFRSNIVDLITKISQFALDYGEDIEELDLNPVILSGKDAIVADAKIILR